MASIVTRLLLLCFVVGAASADGIVSGQVRRFLESFRQDMRCGIPELGLPVLAPLNIASAPLDIELNGLSIHGTGTHLHIPDLDTFTIRTINVNLILLRMDMSLHWQQLRVSGRFLRTVGHLPGACRINGDGEFAVRLRDVTIRMELRMQLRGLQIQLGPMQTTVTVGGFDSQIEHFVADSERCNRQLEQAVPQLIAQNRQRISDQVDEAVRPEVNAFIRGMGLQDLLDLIAAGGDSAGPCGRMAAADWSVVNGTSVV